MSGSRRPAAFVVAALLAAVVHMPGQAQQASSPEPKQLIEARAALQNGDADRTLALLARMPVSAPSAADAHNLACRVYLTLDEWDAAISECEQATRLDAQNSDDHLWLGRALGQKAAHASFLSAFSLARRSHAEFEQAVQLNQRNAEALSDLGDFDRQAPGAVGGGIDKARQVATQLDSVDPARSHRLLGQIAEQQKDYAKAELEYRQAIATSGHQAVEWSNLAEFYFHRQRLPEMESAVKSAQAAASHDKRSGASLYDGAGLLIEAHIDPALAATLLEDYLAGTSKTEEAPAFIAHLRLARLKLQLGDPAAAGRERAAALALAHDYKPALEFNAQAKP